MNHIALGIYYLLIPNNIVIDMFGNEIEIKVHKGNKFIIQNRKQISVSKLPKFTILDARNFNQIFNYET